MEVSALGAGTTVVLRPADRGWELQLGASTTVLVGHGRWRESAPLGRPVVADGAWEGGIWRADLFVITSPHRVRLTLDAEQLTATAVWRTVPLTSPDLLAHLTAPLRTRAGVG